MFEGGALGALGDYWIGQYGLNRARSFGRGCGMVSGAVVEEALFSAPSQVDQSDLEFLFRKCFKNENSYRRDHREGEVSRLDRAPVSAALVSELVECLHYLYYDSVVEFSSYSLVRGSLPLTTNPLQLFKNIEMGSLNQFQKQTCPFQDSGDYARASRVRERDEKFQDPAQLLICGNRN